MNKIKYNELEDIIGNNILVICKCQDRRIRKGKPISQEFINVIYEHAKRLVDALEKHKDAAE